MNFEERAQQALRHYLLALQFFTRIPVTGRLAAWVGFSPEMLRASSAHFPGVGWVVGACACTVYALLYLGLGAAPATPWVAAALSTAATVLLTGGFHEDGLADVADGLGGSQERERALDIMKDSRIGAFGAMALILALLAKTGLLALLGQRGLSPALAALAGAHVVSRFFPLLLVRGLPYIGDSARSKAKPLADSITLVQLTVAMAWCVAPLIVIALGEGVLFVLLALLLSGACTALLTRWFLLRLQGFTGDCLGAVQQVAEIAFYLGAALALGPVGLRTGG
ncbi:MAG: adenosylcobinamide-GDP ribazoletransferase [Burkholderiales bacterium]|nr:adenosylcobinamide-GDP ribazoletransferase [Burkholderiales bacterium]